MLCWPHCCNSGHVVTFGSLSLDAVLTGDRGSDRSLPKASIDCISPGLLRYYPFSYMVPFFSSFLVLLSSFSTFITQCLQSFSGGSDFLQVYTWASPSCRSFGEIARTIPLFPDPCGFLPPVSYIYFSNFYVCTKFFIVIVPRLGCVSLASDVFISGGY